MNEILSHSHSGLRWIVLILFIAAIAGGFGGITGKKEFKESNRKLALFAMIAFHTQFLLGLILYFTSPLVSFAEGFMKDTNLRFYAVEHIAAMSIAMILVTIGYGKMKRHEDSRKKFKAVAVYYGTALIIVVLSIPWPFRIASAGWF